MDPVTAPRVYFVGERVDLRAMEADDMPLVAGWINDERIGVFNGARFPVSLAEQSAWYSKSQSNPAKQKLVICDKGGVKVGVVSLFNIDARNQNAEIGVYVAPDQQRKGYAAEALRLLLRFAFLELNMHKVYATILAFNEGSLRLFGSVGFAPESVRAEAVYTGGEFVDVHVLTLFRRDFA